LNGKKRKSSLSIQKLLFDPLKDEVEKVQEKCLSFDGPQSIETPDFKDSVLHKIKEYDQDVANAALGEKLATRLMGFAKSIDIEHSDLKELFDGQLVSGDFSADCCALLGLAAFAKDNQPLIFTRIKKMLQRGSNYKSIERSLDAPENNQLHVRFVKGRKDRDKIRATKRMQTINVGIIEKKGHDIWSSHGDTFSNYTRNTEVWKSEIEEAQRELDRFNRMGCEDLANGIERDIKNFQTQTKETYFGFNRIPMTHAAVILAKIHGFEIKQSGYRSTYNILIPREFFKDHADFCVEEESRDIDYSWFNYEPRSYTIAELKEKNCISDDMQKIVNYLESFPAANGKPIFDHYRILVPGIAYPKGDWIRASYVNEDGRKVSANSVRIKTEVDMMFIKMGLYCPILLGEKDEHCYFISYWV
jgi:hypothetical protein